MKNVSLSKVYQTKFSLELVFFDARYINTFFILPHMTQIYYYIHATVANTEQRVRIRRRSTTCPKAINL